MALITQRSHRSLQPGQVDGVELPTFVVLTGANGAGKSHLLEALQNGSIVYSDIGELPPEKIRLFPLGQLLAVTEGPVQASAYKEPWVSLYNFVQQEKRTAAVHHPGTAEDQSNWLGEQMVQTRQITRAALDRMLRESGKSLLDLEVEDYAKHAPVTGGIKDPFAASMAEVFLSYAQRRSQNEMAQWRKERKGRGDALSDAEFVTRFGAPPWELLEDALALVKLPYRLIPPPEDVETANYEVTMLDERDVPIRPEDLSSGEKVLLAVAMSLFTGARMSDAIELPRILLLDEADASLHPSMVKSLLTVVEEIFVKQYGVRVILTTHSPSTVALAPPSSLHVMQREGHRVQRATVDEALRLLTVGISALGVRLEDRRQIFVESEYDQAVYQDLYRILKPHLETERSAEFIAAGKRDIGGGCEAVKRFVAQLRDGGNMTVSGIVDRDNREQVLSASDLGLSSNLRHFEIRAEHAQTLISTLGQRLGFAGDGVVCEYQGGFTASVPREFLDTRGHDLETAVVSAFPQLNRFDRSLKRSIVNRAVADKPEFVPKSFVQLLTRLLEE